MRSLFALALAGVSSATLMDSLDYEFMKFVTKFNKRYGTREEYEYRLSLFKQAAHEIEEFNSQN